MVHFVCLSDSAEIEIIITPEPLDSLMDQYIMNKKITEAIGRNSKAHGHEGAILIQGSDENRYGAGCGEYEEKTVVFFKKTLIVPGVMVAVQHPQKSVHDVLVGKPCHKFHKEKRGDQDEDVGQTKAHDQRYFINADRFEVEIFPAASRLTAKVRFHFSVYKSPSMALINNSMSSSTFEL